MYEVEQARGDGCDGRPASIAERVAAARRVLGLEALELAQVRGAHRAVEAALDDEQVEGLARRLARNEAAGERG